MNKVDVKKEKDNKICYIEINHSEKRNILSFQIINQLISIFQEISKDKETKVVILSGKGSHFCAGGDLEWMKLKPDSSDIENLNEVTTLFNLFQVIYQCPVPVITSVQGSVYGGGIGLVAASDITFSDPDTKFCFSELKIGLVPSVISPFVLKKMIQAKAQAYMLSARIFSAEEALNSGLIHHVGSAEERNEHINNLIANFINFDRVAMAKVKELIHFIPGSSLEEAKSICVKILAERRKSPEVTQKINRFLNKK